MYLLLLTYRVNFSSENERFAYLIKIFGKNLHSINHIVTLSKTNQKMNLYNGCKIIPLSVKL